MFWVGFDLKSPLFSNPKSHWIPDVYLPNSIKIGRRDRPYSDFKKKLYPSPLSSHFVTLLWNPFKYDVTNVYPPSARQPVV